MLQHVEPIALDESLKLEIATRKRLEKALSESEEKYKLLINQLHTAADISKQLTAILDPDQLMVEVVNLLKARFDFYHVHIYTLDKQTKNLIMRAGSDEAGQILRQQGHKIPFERQQSLVAQAARTQKIIVVDDVSLEPNFMSNPILPATRSEIAIPLVVKNELLGVLDIQDDKISRFSQFDFDTFNTLAGQIAIALQNANLFVERQQVEGALRESQQLLQSLLDNTTAVIYIKEIGGSYMLVNRQAEKLFNVDLAKIIGKTDHDFFSKEIADKLEESDHQAIQANMIIQTEELLPHADGWHTYFSMKFPLINTIGQPYAVATILSDITTRKKAEEQILTLSHAVEQSPIMVMITDSQGFIQYINPKFSKITGYAAEEIIGKNTRDLGTQSPEEAKNLWRSLLTEGEWHGEFFNQRKNGERYWEAASISIIKNPSGVTTHFVKIAEDITERKQTEEELKQFTYIVSHDLRAPLVNIKGFATELRLSFNQIVSFIKSVLSHLEEEQSEIVSMSLEEDIPEAMDFIDASTSRMDKLITSLLSLSRLGRRNLSFGLVNMNGLVQETLQTLAHQIEKKHVRVMVDSLPSVVADQTAMEQIWGNILANAVAYLSPERLGEIKIMGECNHDETTFHICDNGRGIAESDMPKVFAPFRRAGKLDVPGEGMGLAYVQTLVRRHNGRIWCQSKLIDFARPYSLISSKDSGLRTNSASLSKKEIYCEAKAR